MQPVSTCVCAFVFVSVSLCKQIYQPYTWYDNKNNSTAGAVICWNSLVNFEILTFKMVVRVTEYDFRNCSISVVNINVHNSRI